MKRILVVDDERPVIEGIGLIVKRELAGEFEVAGTASSGREALEKAAALSPDIILMDVRMPGITGIETIRELRSRGSGAAFILVTAYERFDIAREAVGLGILDYLLKPVSRDKLTLALRAASDYLDRRSELERREIEGRETAERLQGFVEAAFLKGIVLGEVFGPELPQYRSALGLAEPLALVGAALLSPPPGGEGGTTALHARFRETLRYKSRSLVGPLVGATTILLVPLREGEDAGEAMAGIGEVVEGSYATELYRGELRLAFGSVRPLEEAALSWAEALTSLWGGGRGRMGGTLGGVGAGGAKPFEADEDFLVELSEGYPEKAALRLELILGELGGEGGHGASYRLISLFGAAYRSLSRRGLLDREEAMAMLDLEDLRAAASGRDLAEVARARLRRLAAIMGRTPRWSAPVAGALAFIKENYGRQVGLEAAADAVGISPNRLSRLLVEETGRGFSDYLIEYRIERARDLLLQPGASIKQVSLTCGYPDPNYFSRLFKKVTGMTPSSFSSGSSEARDEQ